MSVAPVVGGVTDFADELLGVEEGVDLARIGDATESLTDAVRAVGYDGTVTAGLLASLFWQCFILSPAYERAFDDADALYALEGRVDQMVVPHPIGGPLVTPRFDLLVFSEQYDGEAVELEVGLTETELAAGWTEARRGIMNGEHLPSKGTSPAAIAIDYFDALREVYETATFRLLLARRPETVIIAAPNPAWTARAQLDDADFASVGVVARNSDGVLGVTIPNHLFCPDEPVLTPIGTPVSIRDLSGTVVSCDLITDSCFVSLPSAEPSSGFLTIDSEGLVFQERIVAPAAVTQGVACCSAPGAGLKMNFTGALSAVQTATVTGYDPFVYVLSRHIARCLYTDGVTGPGDSGAALVDGTRGVMGFAFEAAKYDAVPQFSSWIWAEAVIRAHGLTLLGQSDFGYAPSRRRI